MKIAAAYSNKVFVFEPTPSAKKATHVKYSIIPFILVNFSILKQNIHYKWIEVGVIELESDIECISWNNDGQRIIIGCAIGTLQIWSYNPNAVIKNKNETNHDFPVKFSIFDEAESDPSNENHSEKEPNPKIFLKIWEKK